MNTLKAIIIQIYEDYVELNQFTTPYDALWLCLFQAACVILCYHSSKFACKVVMQRAGFALPLHLTVPVLLALMSIGVERRSIDPCYMTAFLPKEVFWQFDNQNVEPAIWRRDFWMAWKTWIWLGWWIAQFWITIHLWGPKHERLARSEK